MDLRPGDRLLGLDITTATPSERCSYPSLIWLAAGHIPIFEDIRGNELPSPIIPAAEVGQFRMHLGLSPS